ncbi:nucleoside phosphorylase [Paludibacterium yongneupense]|uniref:nucleoside phosphorylase n=1 Tax=Paludibacterium yongneupense TaxID=400061 RepID=UPI000409FD32|nr:nucleoside phosphorylase [Paludibacterium yongneupense]
MSEPMQPHIRCGRADGAKYAILPGDPERVERVKAFLDNPVDIAFNREYKSCSGSYKGVRVMVISTGIGGPSTGIAVEELKKIGVETLIRIGSCGALKDTLKLGDLVIASGAVRDEGTSRAYVAECYPAVPDPEVLAALVHSARAQGYPLHCGIIHSHDSFYTDQEEASCAYWSRHGVLAADMESAALFVIGGLRHLKTASILNVVVERSGDLESGINEYVEGDSRTAIGERKEIITALEAIARLEQC